MKQKKLAFLAGLLGLGSLTAAGVVAHQKQIEQQRQEVLEEVRTFFSTLGDISVVYINNFESKKYLVTGGVVFEDETTYYFTYDRGEINYRLEGDLEL